MAKEKLINECVLPFSSLGIKNIEFAPSDVELFIRGVYDVENLVEGKILLSLSFDFLQRVINKNRDTAKVEGNQFFDNLLKAEELVEEKAKAKKNITEKPIISFNGKMFINDKWIAFKDLQKTKEGLTDNFKLPLSFIDHIRTKHKNEWQDFNIHD